MHLVSREPLENLPRSRALKIPVSCSASLPAKSDAEVLALEDSWLLQSYDLERLARLGGRLVASDGSPIPAGVLSARLLMDRSTDASAEILQPALRLHRVHRTEALAIPVSNSMEAKLASAALWKSIHSSTDGFVDRWFNRPLGRLFLSKPLIHTPISPNQISLISISIGVAGAWFLGQVEASRVVLGALLFQISAMVDCVDGDVARVLFKESKMGKWLDLGGDQVVHLCVFIGITVGLLRRHTPGPWAILGAVTVVGAILSFCVVLRGILNPRLIGNYGLQRFVDAATTRDFSVLVLVLAVWGHLEWFLWMAAMGSHVFWVTAVTLQRRALTGSDVP